MKEVIIFTKEEKTQENIDAVLKHMPNHNWGEREKQNWLEDVNKIGVGQIKIGYAYAVSINGMARPAQDVVKTQFKDFIKRGVK